MMNSFMEPTAPGHHPHHLAYGLKMSPPLQSSPQDNSSSGSLLTSMSTTGSDHNAVGINPAYQASGYGPTAATTYPSYGRDYMFKRDQEYLTMSGQTANTATADPMIFPTIHHSMHDNQFAYHQHQMRMGITGGSTPAQISSSAASVPQTAGKNEIDFFYTSYFVWFVLNSARILNRWFIL